jgi:hypothetical protein
MSRGGWILERKKTEEAGSRSGVPHAAVRKGTQRREQGVGAPHHPRMSGRGQESPRKKKEKKIKKCQKHQCNPQCGSGSTQEPYQRKCRGRGASYSPAPAPAPLLRGPPPLHHGRTSAPHQIRISSTPAPATPDPDLLHPQHLQSTRAAPKRRPQAADEPRRPDSGTEENGGSGEPERRTSRSCEKGDLETRARRGRPPGYGCTWGPCRRTKRLP